uniref:Uncharacterized protein n=1 Tax=Lotharella oceanica TaxID=641309 RepID=A0A7S2TGB9_9EUKA|mmetsp:Transcript_12933/g.24727  ORF Transcript_12933/g.24727 Transcript_12933/m.24727 type:complete len:156 (+) Transcript_12933:466-933(+)
MVTGEEELVTRDAETAFFYLKTAEVLGAITASPYSWNENTADSDKKTKFMTPQQQYSRLGAGYIPRYRSLARMETEHKSSHDRKEVPMTGIPKTNNAGNKTLARLRLSLAKQQLSKDLSLASGVDIGSTNIPSSTKKKNEKMIKEYSGLKQSMYR